MKPSESPVSRMSLKPLLEGAILIADAHCAPWRTPFIDFLRALESGKITTPQLILMGDIFDMLYGPIKGSYRYNAEGIELLDRLARKMEIIYLEGNHDFLLQDIWPNVSVVRRESQPLLLSFEGKTVSLSHGDYRMGTGYEIYTALIRNRFILAALRGIDTWGGGFVLRWLEKQMQRKSHCKEIKEFDQLIAKRFSSASEGFADIVIEGHFHQNRVFHYPTFDYINVGAFACNERYFTVQSTQNMTLLREEVFRKEPL